VSICLQGQGSIIKTVGTHGPGGSPGTFPSCAVATPPSAGGPRSRL